MHTYMHACMYTYMNTYLYAPAPSQILRQLIASEHNETRLSSLARYELPQDKKEREKRERKEEKERERRERRKGRRKTDSKTPVSKKGKEEEKGTEEKENGEEANERRIQGMFE